jgi:hypothetical protein
LTKIALISDLHLEERKDPPLLGTPPGMFQVYGSLSLPREIDADIMVIAGDTHPDPEIRSQVLRTTEDELGLPEPMGLWMVCSEAHPPPHCPTIGLTPADVLPSRAAIRQRQ